MGSVSSTLQAQIQSTWKVNPEDVTIVRDTWGVPHIYAPTDAEVAYGVAWAQAEDKFKTMQQSLMFTKGLLGRVYGKSGAAADFLSGFVDMQSLVEERMSEDVSPEFMRYLEGFCQGLNSYAEKHPDDVLHKKLFPVTPADMLASYPLKIAAFIGMGGTLQELLYKNRFEKLADSLDMQEERGSNAFAVSRKITTNEKTYLIANPHVEIEGAEGWYELHVVSEEGLNFHGAMFPGSVSPQIGTNMHLGWTHTNNYYDDTDVFLLEMHPEKPLYYRFDDQWLPLEKRRVKLKVKLKWLPIPVTAKKTVYRSVYGPTIKSKSGRFFSIRMAPIFTIKTAEQWFRMNKASDLEEFKDALSLNGLSYFNITYADKDDNVFYIFNGLFPERAPGYDWRDLVPGNTAKTLWDTYVPLEERPQILNPDCGYVFNVNHNPYKCTCEDHWLDRNGYDSLVRYDQRDENPRSRRVRELLPHTGKISMADLKKIKYDARWPMDDPFAKIVARLQTYENDTLADVLAPIREWDLDNDIDAVAPTILFLFRMQRPSANMKDEDMARALQYAKDHLLKHFGTVDVPWGSFSRIRRGDAELPAYGYDDLLGNRWSRLDPENGKAYTRGGDTFMMFAQYDDEGLAVLETVVPYGNSDIADSPHYADQMKLYSEQMAKTIPLDRKSIFDTAERIYHPR
jgi:acyl-homoserine-lactone acylase